MKPRVFVAIAAYRDPECQWTIDDLFQRAADAARISVGVCWQILPGQDDYCFLIEPRPAQVRRALHDASKALGLGWARSIAHSLWQGEEYVLQIDSHMRFHDGWDEQLIDMLRDCPSPRPLLSHYPAAYTPPHSMDSCACSRLWLEGQSPAGLPCIESERLRTPLDGPRPALLLAGGFLFASAGFFRQVPYDPVIGFTSEEVAFSARAFTHGFDAFVPSRCVVHHYYERTGAPAFTNDAAHGLGVEERSIRRLQHLLEVAPSQDPHICAETAPGERYGMGLLRSLAEFEQASGVRWRTPSRPSA